MGFCPKISFLQLKHIQRIFLTLLSTTCVKIDQIIYVIFETMSHFSQHNSSVSFQLKHYILLQKYPIIVQVFRLSTNQVKFHRIPHVIFQIKVSFSSKFGSFFSSSNNSAVSLLKLYLLLIKVAHQSTNFQTCYCSHENSPNF